MLFFRYFGAEWLVGGASAFARVLRIPQLIIGLTVVAYGTSTPEIIVGIQAASAGHSGVALGNVVGSNIANIGLILGIATLVKPARVNGALRHRELPLLVMSTSCLPLFLSDGVISSWEASLLLLAAFGYSTWMVFAARTAAAVATAQRAAPLRRSVTQPTLRVHHRLAIGTSLPELVTIVIALGPLALQLLNVSSANLRRVGSANHHPVVLGQSLLRGVPRSWRRTSSGASGFSFQVDSRPLPMLG